MKRTFLAALFALLTLSAAAGEAFRVNHGPYLQGVTYDSATVMFTTSQPALSKVELRRAGDSEVRICDSRADGLIMADNTDNAITIGGLEPATEYEYRIVAVQVTDFQPYSVEFGERTETPWYRFRTFDPAARSFACVVMNDIHDTPAKCGALLDAAPLDEVDMVFYLGDMMNYFVRPEQPYESFIDISVDRFARSKPFAVVRGNHETRGRLARSYGRYVRNNPEGRYYGVWQFGDTVVVMLDCGEDKPDDSPVYGGFAAFDQYREQQMEWLRGVVRSKAFRKARHRIVMIHIPPVDGRMQAQDPKLVTGMLEWHGNRHWGELLLPLLNDANIDLMLSGHQHSFHYLPAMKGVHDFPMVINDNNSAVVLRSDKDGISVTVTDIDGTRKFEKRF